VGAQRIGISADQVDQQKEFDSRNQLGFLLLSDPEQEISTLLGAKRFGPLGNRRITFVIDSDRTLLKVIKSETNMMLHADEALKTLKERH
tara:strand:- start:161 stop:430 length:270 start_codon:yes stop_codon:yes gene_type:complete